MKDKKLLNIKRAKRISWYRRQNLNLRTAMQVFCKDNKNLSHKQNEELENFSRKLFQCGGLSLYREESEKDNTYMHSLTCKHKMCFICNSERKRKLRLLYYHFFTVAEPDIMKKYDFMHLTLTVPHTLEGWKGSKVYNKELLQSFNELRKLFFWKQDVFAGEYSVEVTKNKNGLHVHIHSLLLVEKGLGNRNALYVNILKAWNKLTIWGDAKEFEEKRIEGIKKSLGFLGESAISVIDRLNPNGSTLVGLESLYTYQKGKKQYCTGEPQSMINGIMETMKYHFEPAQLYKDKGAYDVALLAEIVPMMKGERLYGKFGAFYKEKRLNLSSVEDISFEDLAKLGILADDKEQSENQNYKVLDPLNTRGDKKLQCFGQPKMTLTGNYKQVFATFRNVVAGSLKEDSIKFAIQKSNNRLNQFSAKEAVKAEPKVEFSAKNYFN